MTTPAESLWGTRGPIRLDSIAVAWEGITGPMVGEWRDYYPDVTLMDELDKAAHWCVAHGARGRKANYKRFIENWLQAQQDNADGLTRAQGTRKRAAKRQGPSAIDSLIRETMDNK